MSLNARLPTRIRAAITRRRLRGCRMCCRGWMSRALSRGIVGLGIIRVIWLMMLRLRFRRWVLRTRRGRDEELWTRNILREAVVFGCEWSSWGLVDEFSFVEKWGLGREAV